MNNSGSYKIIHSLGFKLLLLILFLGIIPFSVLVPLSLQVYKTVSITSDAQNLQAQSLTYNNEIVTSGFLNGGDYANNVEQELMAVADSYRGRILIVNSSLRIVKDSYGVDEGKTVIWENVIRSAKGEKCYYYDEDNKYLIVSVPLTNSDGEVVGALILNKAMDYLDQNTDIFMSYYLIAAVVLAALVVLMAITFSIRYARPLSKTNKYLDNIIKDYATLLPSTESYSELENITVKFNDILKKLHDIDDSRQEFVSNVSHELKTPLTSMKVLADSLNGAGDDIPIEMYKEFMQDIGDEIDRETKIINDLLALVRMDKSGAHLDIKPVNMNELIELVLKRLKPIAEKASVEVVYESFRPVVAEIDEVKMTLVITNLVENAIKYNNEGGYVHISLNSDHQYCYIKVEDNGLGIPEESIDYIFERFYRADKSHSREIGGTGLGLAITKNAIVMHRGDVAVHSRLGEGSTFDVRIPLNYIEEEH